MLRRLTFSLTVTIYCVMVLSGCSDDGGSGSSVPFSALTSLDGPGYFAKFNTPSNCISDGTNLYVADTANHTIRKVVISTGVVSTLAGAAGASGTADGTGSAARFNNPLGITTDGIHLYVTDSKNHTIRKIEISSGVVTTLAGTAGSSGTSDGIGTVARFNSPFGITTDWTNLYVADSKNDTIRKIEISSGVVTTLAGTAGTSGTTDGTGTAAKFYFPAGITTDGANLYVADTDSHTIRAVLIATGAVTTLAGAAGTSGKTDGTGTAALFNYPLGISTDGTNLHVADYKNHTIRTIVIASGAVTTLAGTAGTSGSTDGTGTAARFNLPAGLTTDGTNVYVADSANNTIRKIVIATGAVTTLAGRVQ